MAVTRVWRAMGNHQDVANRPGDKAQSRSLWVAGGGPGPGAPRATGTIGSQHKPARPCLPARSARSAPCTQALMWAPDEDRHCPTLTPAATWERQARSWEGIPQVTSPSDRAGQKVVRPAAPRALREAAEGRAGASKPGVAKSRALHGGPQDQWPAAGSRARGGKASTKRSGHFNRLAPEPPGQGQTWPV